MQTFRVIPFIKLQNDTQTTVKRWRMRRRTKTLIFFWLSCVVFMASAWKSVGMSITSVELQGRPAPVMVQHTLYSGKDSLFSCCDWNRTKYLPKCRKAGWLLMLLVKWQGRWMHTVFMVHAILFRVPTLRSINRTWHKSHYAVCFKSRWL